MSLNLIVKSIVSLTLIASVSFADILTKELSGKENSGVKLSKAASVKVDQYNVNLTQVAAGLRTKKVLIANVKVYTAEVFVSEPQTVVKTDADLLTSVAQSKTAVVQLTFLRDVEADKVQVSFRDALVANNIDINSVEVNVWLQQSNKLCSLWIYDLLFLFFLLLLHVYLNYALLMLFYLLQYLHQ